MIIDIDGRIKNKGKLPSPVKRKKETQLSLIVLQSVHRLWFITNPL